MPLVVVPRYTLVVVDEAHHVYDNPEAKRQIEKGEPVEAVAFGESLDLLERSFDAAKHRSPFNEPPAMQLRQPTVETPSLAPSGGQHVATVLVHGVPFDVEGGWTDARRDELSKLAMASLERFRLMERRRLSATTAPRTCDRKQR